MKYEIVFTESRTYRAIIELPDSVLTVEDARQVDKEAPLWMVALEDQEPNWEKSCLEKIEFQDILSFSRVPSQRPKR